MGKNGTAVFRGRSPAVAAALSHSSTTLSMSSSWNRPWQQNRWSTSSAASRTAPSPQQQQLETKTNVVHEDGAFVGVPPRSQMRLPPVPASRAVAHAASPRQLWTKGSPIVFSRKPAGPAVRPGPPLNRPWAPRAVSASMAVARAQQHTVVQQQQRRRSFQASKEEPYELDVDSKESMRLYRESFERKAREEILKSRPPETDLPMKIPLEAWHRALAALSGTPTSFWTYTLYRREGEEGEAGEAGKAGEESHRAVKVHYSRSLQTTERVLQEHFVGEPLLGLDLEWMASAMRHHSARRNVCLVQLASPTRIGLFHLAAYPAEDELVAPTLRRILEDPGVIKAGVNIKGDCTRLRTHLGVAVQGSFELSHLHKLVKYSQTGETRLINKRLVPMADQVQATLGLPMFKGMDVRAGDWSRPLDAEQMLYSASDAYAAVQLFAVLEKKRLALKPTPPRPAFSELDMPIKLADGVTKKSTAEGQSDGEASEDAAKAEAKAKVKTPCKPQTPKPELSPLEAANAWVEGFRKRKRNSSLQPQPLRAYYLWAGDKDKNNGRHVSEVAALLRDPPLATSTVVGYILQVLQWEGKLYYDRERLRTEVLSTLSEATMHFRYWKLLRASNCLDMLEALRREGREAYAVKREAEAANQGAGEAGATHEPGESEREKKLAASEP